MPFLSRKKSDPPLWLYQRFAGDGPSADPRTDEALLEKIQKAAFDYFANNAHPRTGLVADASRDGAPSSIAAIGFALSAFAIGVERGWMARGEALERSLRVLRFLEASDQSGSETATGHRGFYFHFLDMESGARTWDCELSMIDSAILLIGCLMAATYYSREDAGEGELRRLAHALYARVDWNWAQDGSQTVSLGWKPGHGFLNYAWQGYSEALLMYVLGLAAPKHPLGEDAFRTWTLTYQWENLYGYDVLYAGPLFIHQLSHAWIDFRGLRDEFMREKKIDYFENSRRAAYVHREYAIRNPLGFEGYAHDCWGWSAGDGPKREPVVIDGRRQSFYGYSARGAPNGPDDGTVAGSGAIGSLVFAPEIVMPVVRKLVEKQDDAGGRRVLASGFNDTVADDAGAPWVSHHQIGFDQGLIVMMIENHRSGLPWRLMRGCAVVRTGLERAGFRGGWLTQGRSVKHGR